jgi:protein-tyrosine phosphatase
MSERSLGLVGAPNARDLGGLPVAGGRRVRRGVLLRSGAPGRLVDRDLDVLAGLRLALVMDLRHESEIALAPGDRLPGADPALPPTADRAPPSSKT